MHKTQKKRQGPRIKSSSFIIPRHKGRHNNLQCAKLVVWAVYQLYKSIQITEMIRRFIYFIKNVKVTF